jgi:hypothetical protein
MTSVSISPQLQERVLTPSAVQLAKVVTPHSPKLCTVHSVFSDEEDEVLCELEETGSLFMKPSKYSHAENKLTLALSKKAIVKESIFFINFILLKIVALYHIFMQNAIEKGKFPQNCPDGLQRRRSFGFAIIEKSKENWMN